MAAKSKDYKKNKELEKERKTSCAICGEDDKCCLEFHHVRDKKYSISSAASKLSYKTFKEELDKCICICKNCHAKLHGGSISEDNYPFLKNGLESSESIIS